MCTSRPELWPSFSCTIIFLTGRESNSSRSRGSRRKTISQGKCFNMGCFPGISKPNKRLALRMHIYEHIKRGQFASASRRTKTSTSTRRRQATTAVLPLYSKSFDENFNLNSEYSLYSHCIPKSFRVYHTLLYKSRVCGW